MTSRIAKYQLRFQDQAPAMRSPLGDDLKHRSRVLAANAENLRTIDTKDLSGTVLKLVGYSDDSERRLKEAAENHKLDRISNSPHAQIKAAVFHNGKLVGRSFPYVPKLVVQEDEIGDHLRMSETIREWKEGLVFFVYWISVREGGQMTEKMMFSTNRRIDSTNSSWFQSPKLHEMIAETGVNLNSLDHRYCHVLLLQHPYMLIQSQEELTKPCIWLLQSWKRVNNTKDSLRTLERADYVHGTIKRTPFLTRDEALAAWKEGKPIITRRSNSWRVFISPELAERYRIASENRNVFYRYVSLGEERSKLKEVVPLCKKTELDNAEERYQAALSTLRTILLQQATGKMPSHPKHKDFVADLLDKVGLDGSDGDLAASKEQELKESIDEMLGTISGAYIYAMSCSGDVRAFISYQNRKPLTLGDFIPEGDLPASGAETPEEAPTAAAEAAPAAEETFTPATAKEEVVV